MDRWRTWNAQKLPGRAVSRWVRGWVATHCGTLAGIEVHRTACIVTHPPGGDRANDALVNPANEQLAGTRFTPEECWKNLHGDPTTGRWDKEYATYPSQAIDGLVTEFGGDALRIALEALPVDGEGSRCPTGGALLTPATSELCELYKSLIHAVPPFRRGSEASDWAEKLQRTYHSSFDVAAHRGLEALAVPLLGAGARGASVSEAMSVAASAAVSWRAGNATSSGPPPLVRFGVQDSSTAHALVAALEEKMTGADGFQKGSPPEVESPAGRWALS